MLRCAYSRNDPVAAHGSNSCSEFSGVKAVGGGVCLGALMDGREDCFLLDDCDLDVERRSTDIVAGDCMVASQSSSSPT